jgi:hypothetical protein
MAPAARSQGGGVSALTALLNMQALESAKPVVSCLFSILRNLAVDPLPIGQLNATHQLSKISWLPDVLRFRGSIIPSIVGPVLSVTLWSAGVASLQMIVRPFHLCTSREVLELTDCDS